MNAAPECSNAAFICGGAVGKCGDAANESGEGKALLRFRLLILPR